MTLYLILGYLSYLLKPTAKQELNIKVNLKFEGREFRGLSKFL